MSGRAVDNGPGVLPSQWIRAAIERGTIGASPAVTPEQVQPNSLDLRLGAHGWRVQCSFLPGDEGMESRLARLGWYEFAVGPEGVVLERNQVYFFPLMEELDLPDTVYASANPKSSTGRLDVFVRVVTERGSAFDAVPHGYRGRLYAEVVPRSFAVRVRPGDSLAQIRFQQGDPRLTREETLQLLDAEDVLFDPNLHTLRSLDVTVNAGLLLSVSLPRRGEPTVGYQARKNTRPIDLQAIGAASIRNYWDRIHGDSKPVILEPDEFYIFASRELVRLPADICAEMVPFDAGAGELRTHYAGFFDSGFGYTPGAPPESSAAAVVLEVRSRDVPFVIEDGQPLFRLALMRCTEPPDILYGGGLQSNYQSQRLRLSKHFSATGDDDRSGAAQTTIDFAGSRP